METKKEQQVFDEYETPSIVTYEAEDILEEIAISSYNCSGGEDPGDDDGTNWYWIPF